MYKSDYPTYLVHFNRNHDPKNGQFAEGDGDGDGVANDHDHYKKMKSDYKASIKSAKKEFRKVVKESGKNKVFASNKTRRKAAEIVDRYAVKKSAELYEQYIELKKYKAKMAGKEFDPNRLGAKEYFMEIGLDPNILGIPYPTINEYSTRPSRIDQIPMTRKDSTRWYFISGGN